MGTVVSFDLRSDAGPQTARGAIDDAVAWLHRVDEIFSTYREDSEISRLNRRELRLRNCAPEVGEVLDLCGQASAHTHGYFSPTFGGRLDPTGLVKGWAIQRASEMLRAAGVSAHAVNGGGDIQAAGEPEPGRRWNIAISHPLHRDKFAGVVEIRDGAVATSGIVERGLHVLDPFTGRAASDLLSVTVVGKDLTFADAYATAALAMGSAARDWLEELPGYEGFAISPDGSGWTTSGYRMSGSVSF